MENYERLMKVKEGSSTACVGCSGHKNHTHGVGVTGAGAPAGQDDHNVALFEETSGLAWKMKSKTFYEPV